MQQGARESPVGPTDAPQRAAHNGGGCGGYIRRKTPQIARCVHTSTVRIHAAEGQRRFGALRRRETAHTRAACWTHVWRTLCPLKRGKNTHGKVRKRPKCARATET